MPIKKELTTEYIDKKFRDFFIELTGVFASKDDLKAFATKDDLKAFATKDDLKNFATKDDLLNMESRINTKFATKDDLKAELAKQSKELKAFAEEQTDNLARIISTTVAEPLEKHLKEISAYEEVGIAIWKQISKKQKRI